MPVLTVHGFPVRYDRVGDGPTVVLLHGGGLDSAQLSWAPLTSRLVAHADVICPDLPGYGGSPLGTTSPTVAGYATGCAPSSTQSGCAAACSVACHWAERSRCRWRSTTLPG